MSWFNSEPTVLKFDIDQIRLMRNRIEKTIVKLDENKRKVIDDMEKLKKNWKTPAGDKFIKEVNVDWADQVTKYIHILDTVDELLKVAEENYEQVLNEITSINF